MTAWNLRSVEKSFAKAALDPSLWQAALNTAVTASDSYGAVLIPNTGGLLPNVPYTESMASSFSSYVEDGWYLRDERNRGIGIMRQRGVVDDLDTMGADAIKRHPYYQEFLAPHGLRWFAGVRIECGDDLWCLSVQRTIDQGPFSPEEKLSLMALSNSLSASAAIAKALGNAATMGALNAFEASGSAVLLVNRAGLIFEANAAAERMVGDDVKLAEGRLRSLDRSANAQLDRVLREVMWQVPGGTHAVPVALPRQHGLPLLAYPSLLSRGVSHALGDCHAIIILIDPSRSHEPPESDLRRIFHLTPAEARLAAHLASGASLDLVSEQLQIKKQTGRTQLKSVFAKLGVHRQSELVAILAPLLRRAT